MSSIPCHSPASAISSRLFVLVAALSVALTGCNSSAPGSVGAAEFEPQSAEETLVKPAPSNAISIDKDSFATLSASLPDNNANTVTAASRSDDQDDAISSPGNEDEQVECTDADLLGNLSVEIDGPAVAFMDDNISEAVKVVLYNDQRGAQDKVEVSLHLSDDSKLDEGDLILTQPEHTVTGPDAFSVAQIDLGKLQPLVGIPSGKYHVIVRIDEQSASSDCVIDDNVASFPLEIL